jgi:hypothetical protein
LVWAPKINNGMQVARLRTYHFILAQNVRVRSGPEGGSLLHRRNACSSCCFAPFIRWSGRIFCRSLWQTAKLPSVKTWTRGTYVVFGGGTPAKCVGEAHYPQVSGPICSPHSFLSCLKSLADFSSATESSLSFFFHLPHWMKAQSASYVAGWPLRGEVVMAVFVSAESKYCSLHLPIIVFYFVSKSNFASLFQCNCSCFLPRFLLFPRKFLLYWLTEKTLHH